MAGRHGDSVVVEIPTLHDTKGQRIELPKFDRHWTNIKPHCAGSNEGSVSFWLKFRLSRRCALLSVNSQNRRPREASLRAYPPAADRGTGASTARPPESCRRRPG